MFHHFNEYYKYRIIEIDSSEKLIDYINSSGFLKDYTHSISCYRGSALLCITNHKVFQDPDFIASKTNSACIIDLSHNDQGNL